MAAHLDEGEVCSAHHKAEPEDIKAMEEVGDLGEKETRCYTHQDRQEDGEGGFRPSDIPARRERGR